MGAYTEPTPAQWESYLHGTELDAMNALKRWHSHRQVPPGVLPTTLAGLMGCFRLHLCTSERVCVCAHWPSFYLL